MRRDLRIYLALAALALLFGIAAAYIVPDATDALLGHELAAEALSSLVAAGVLFAAAALIGRRRSASQPRPRLPLRILLLLLAPPLLAAIAKSQILPQLPRHEPQWADAVALDLGAPLWLALLAALGLTSVEVPRILSGAGIAAIAALFYVTPTAQWFLQPDQLPMFVFELGLAILTVYAWTRAQPLLAAGVGALHSAASFLLVRFAADTVVSIVLERTSLAAVNWHQALLALAFDALLAALALTLWFWLLGHMPLPAFALHPLASWSASVLAGIVLFGWSNWRMDLAVSVDIVALIVGLRARVSDQEPVSLDLAL